MTRFAAVFTASSNNPKMYVPLQDVPLSLMSDGIGTTQWKGTRRIFCPKTPTLFSWTNDLFQRHKYLGRYKTCVLSQNLTFYSNRNNGVNTRNFTRPVFSPMANVLLTRTMSFFNLFRRLRYFPLELWNLRVWLFETRLEENLQCGNTSCKLLQQHKYVNPN